jgi:predicted flap endonuclease-1-like 5' DNA nuclease
LEATPVTYRIQEIEGIGPTYAKKLAQSGITNTKHLLEQCASAKGRRTVAQATGLDESQLLKWANMADLMRISGVGEEYSELLEAAGVDTVKELKQRKAENLAARMEEVNAARQLVRQRPSVKQVTRWIEQAKSLAPTISH